MKINKKNQAYHSIGLDFSRLKMILNNGLMSKKYSLDQGLNIFANFNNGHNGDEYISLSYPYEIESAIFSYLAFPNYTKDKITLIIDISEYQYIEDQGYFEDYETYDYFDKKHLFHSGYKDEIYIKDYISSESIRGIMIPKSFINKPLSSMDIGIDKIPETRICDYIRYVLIKLKQEFNYELSESLNTNLNDKLDRRNTSPEFIEYLKFVVPQIINEALTSYYKMDNMTVLDAIKEITDHRYPIYSTAGIQIFKPRNKILK